MIAINFSETPEIIATQKPKDNPETVKQVAKEFESLLLTQITSALRTKPDETDGEGTDSSSTDLSQQLLAEQMAQVIANNGGIGLVDVLMEKLQIQKQELSTKNHKLGNLIGRDLNSNSLEPNIERITRPRRVFEKLNNEKGEEKIPNLINQAKQLPKVKSLDSISLPPDKAVSAKKLEEIILQTGKRHGIDPHLIAAVIHQESGGKQFAISNKGAVGYMQLMPATFKQFSQNGKNIFDAEDNINAGVAYLKFLSDKYDGDINKVLAGYNAGPGNVSKYNGIPPFAETRRFVENVKSQHAQLVANNNLTNLIAKNAKLIERNPVGAKNVVRKNQPALQTTSLKTTASSVSKVHSKEDLNLPVKGRISSNFGAARTNHSHKGVDIAVGKGTPINAAATGKVVFSGWQKGYGKTLVIEHNDGRLTRYAHAENLLVSKGDTVNVGQKIATVGSTGHSTGPHLHFEVIENGKAVNPLVAINNKNVVKSPVLATPIVNKTNKAEKTEHPITLATIIPLVP